MKELAEIQGAISVPKKLYNSFGKYYYRSAECILEAAKPLLHKHKCTLNLSDEVVLIGERYYVRAVATIRNSTGEEVSTTAYAREAEDKKGMDPAQVTGATSSYARKYALNGLFALDDVKDADSTNTHGKDTPATKTPPKSKQAQTPQQPDEPEQSLAEAHGWIDSCRNVQELAGVWGKITAVNKRRLEVLKDKKKQELAEAGK